MADRRYHFGDGRLLQVALTRSVRGHQFYHVGTAASGSHERDGLRLGIDGRNGHGRLVDGKIVPVDVAVSTVDRCRRCVLECGRANRRGRNPARR